MEIARFFNNIADFFNFFIPYSAKSNFTNILPFVIESLAMALFVAASSGGKRWSVRKTAASAAFTAVIVPFAGYGYYYNYDGVKWFPTAACLIILCVCSLSCGEKKLSRMISLSAVAINADTLIWAFVANSRFEIGKLTVSADESLKIISYASPGKATEFISAGILAVVLFAATILLKKKQISLDSRAGAAVAASLLISTVLVTFLQIILFWNRRYVYFKIISLSQSRSTIVLSIVSLLLILILNVTVYVLIMIINRQNRVKTEYAIMQQQYEGQSAIIEEVSRRHVTVSQMRHDLIAALGTVNELIKSGKYEEASSFIEKQTGRLSSDVRCVNTNNEYVNSLISYETAKAKERDIDVSVYSVREINFPDSTDLCSLIGNMFDNAIRAAGECSGAKTVRLDICRDKEAYRITMLNSVKAPVLAENPSLQTTKEDKISHGFGTKIIKEIAEKYYGAADFYDAPDGRFCCSVLVYPEKPY